MKLLYKRFFKKNILICVLFLAIVWVYALLVPGSSTISKAEWSRRAFSPPPGGSQQSGLDNVDLVLVTG